MQTPQRMCTRMVHALSLILVMVLGFALTAPAAVKRVYTNLAVLDVTPAGFVVLDMAPGMTLETLQKVTDAPLRLQS